MWMYIGLGIVVALGVVVVFAVLSSASLSGDPETR
jgi:hypothetical protein